MIARHLVEVVNAERALVLHFGVVEEKPLDPEACGRLACLSAKLFDNAGDRDELDLVGISDDDLIKQDRPGGVIMCVDEAGHDRQLTSIKCLRPRANQGLDLVGTSHRDKPVGFDRKGLRSRREWIDSVDLRVEHHEIGGLRSTNLGNSCANRPRRTDKTADTGTREAYEFSPVKAVLGHRETPLSPSPPAF